MSKRLTKPKFAEVFADHLNTSTSKAKSYIDDILSELEVALFQNQNIQIRRFGSFYLRCRASRKIVMPSGKISLTKPKIVPRFRPSKELVKRIDEQKTSN